MSSRLRVGVIGTGAMGAAHARTLATWIAGAEVRQVFDPDVARAKALAEELGAVAASTPEALIEAGDVDAFVIASPDATHAELAIAGIELGKPVMCEKPLAGSPAEARRVVDAELAVGRRLVQLGFCRRYDPDFLALKAATGALGQVRLLHAVHRNASNHTSVDDSSLITGSMIHELDTLPWLLDQELTGIRVESPLAEGFRDPQLATLRFASGALASVEVFVNAGYGYDVQCELVGSAGVASLEPRSSVTTRSAGIVGGTIGSDGTAHFADAYRAELAAWVAWASAGDPGWAGPDAWDGYLATLAAAAGVRSLASGGWESVVSEARPTLYVPGGV